VSATVFILQHFWFDSYAHNNAAFTLTGFDDQERNLTFMKNGFPSFKKLAFYPLHKQNIAWPWQHENTFIQVFLSVPGCQTCMCKRSF